jgi:hypothetical protein
VEENNRKEQNVARGEILKLVLNNIVIEKEMGGAVPWRGEISHWHITNFRRK